MPIEVTVADAEMQGGRLWFSNASLNGLFSMDPDTFEVRFEALFPGEDIVKRLIHRWVFSYCDRLYFIPFMGQTIHIYDGKEISSIPIEKNKNPYYLISDAVFGEVEKRIYLMPMDNEADLRYLDLESNCIHDVLSFRQHLSKLDSNEPTADFQILNTYLFDGELCFLYGYKWLVKWNIIQEFMAVYEVAHSSDNMAYYLLSDRKRLWVYFQNGDMAALEGTDCTKIKIQFNTSLEDERVIACVGEQNGYTWFFSAWAQMLLKYKNGEATVEKISMEGKLQKSDIPPGFTEFVCVKQRKGNLYLFTPFNRGVLQMKGNGKIRQVISNFYSDDIRSLYWEYFFAQKKGIVMENDIELSDFMKYVCQKE